MYYHRLTYFPDTGRIKFEEIEGDRVVYKNPKGIFMSAYGSDGTCERMCYINYPARLGENEKSKVRPMSKKEAWELLKERTKEEMDKQLAASRKTIELIEKSMIIIDEVVLDMPVVL